MGLDDLLKNENYRQNQKKEVAQQREAERKEKSEIFKIKAIECFDNVIDKKIDDMIETFTNNHFWASKEKAIERMTHAESVRHSFFSIRVRNITYQFDIVAIPPTQTLEIKVYRHSLKSETIKTFKDPGELTADILESLIEKEISAILT